MLNNPSYLIKSRHSIYYFRYPLPVETHGKANRVSISLKTRCPKEALRLAKALEYHSLNLLEGIDWNLMQHAEIMSLLKSHYSEVLERSKARINESGVFTKAKKEGIENYIKQLDEIIANDSDSFEELLDGEPSSEGSIHDDLKKITDKYELELDSKEYEMMKKAYKHVRRNHFTDLLTYNNQVFNYSLLNTSQTTPAVDHSQPEYRLENVIKGYLKELKPNITPRSYKDQLDCLNYLSDFFGADYPVTKIDVAMVRDVKEKLQNTPKGRNKGKLTKGRPVLEQIAIAEVNSLDTLSAASVNKYLGYFSCLLDWAKQNRFVEDNLFDGIRVKHNKKENRRDMFDKDEVALILKELEVNNSGKVKNKSQYWGALIAIYTGARRNEISGLLVSDVKQDKETDIWYFDISDEKAEGKDLKTEAARRLVPIHSRLIELGFMDYWKEAKAIVETMPKENGMEARLLYDFTYTKHDKWGRKLGQFMNDRLLRYLGLHVKNKKTLHSLRHSFITYLDVAKVKATTIKSMVGHEQGTVTHGIYTHYGIDHLPQFKEAIESLPY